MDRQALQKIPKMSEQFIPVKQMRQLEHQINVLNDIMLISGPSQADFSTLAYSIIKEIRSTHTKKIMTVEDSPAWLLNEVDQCQINPKADFNRSDALTSCLNLHPEVLYVQDIKDPDIIDDIKNAAESGKFIIAGIIAADVFDALYLTRLRIGSAITSIINQQNVRRLDDVVRQRNFLQLARNFIVALLAA